MFTYGSQVNPSLLRQDFSPILQAAQAQAQATQQAAQIRAQSLANIGSTIGGAIQTYVQKKEEKEKRKGSIDFISRVFQSQPNLAKTFQVPLDESGKPDQKALGSILDNFKSPDEAIRSFMALNEFAEQGKARQQQADAARFAQMFDNQGQMLSPLRSDAGAQFSPEARAMGQQMVTQRAQGLATLGKTQADTAEALARAAEIRGGKPTPGYATPDEALKESKKLAAGQTGLSPSFTVVQGRYFPILKETPPSTFEPKDVQLAAESAQKRLDDFKSRFSTQIGAEQSAILVQEGIKKGVKTGAYTPITTYLKRAANDVGIKMEGLDEEVLAQKGIAGMQAGQIQLLARGLGSMSNADREFFTASVTGITDPTKANQFFAELTLENAKLARQDQAYVRELERKNTSAAEINRLLDERIESRNVAKSVYDRVFTSKANVSANAGQFLN